MSRSRLPALIDTPPWTAPEVGALSDAELLARFTAERDADAFTALLRRHGRLVWGVCRRVLRREQDAEDAFQATFLVLARHAGSIRTGTALAGWLHGTAYHIATRARRDAATRRKHEMIGADMSRSEASSESSWRELLAILDEELQHLPQKQRSAFVLCVLEGHSPAEAAGRLGWKEGTLSGTLSRAREQLRQRLARRGVGLSALVTGLALWRESAAPAALLENTVRAALAYAAGNSANATASPSVAAMVRAASRSLAFPKLRLFALMLAVTVAAGLTGLAGQKPAPQKATEPRAESPRPAQTDSYGDPIPPGALARLGTVRLRSGGYIDQIAFSADSKQIMAVSRNGRVHSWEAPTGKPLRSFRTLSWAAHNIRLSPDGKLVAASVFSQPTDIGLWDTATQKLVRRLEVPEGGKAFRLVFSPDGKTLLSTGGQGNKVCFWDVATGKLVRQVVLKTVINLLDVTPDGQTLVSRSAGNPGWVHLWDPHTGAELHRFPVNYNNIYSYAFTPDSTTLACGNGSQIDLWEAATGKKLAQIKGRQGLVFGLAYSPDGKTLASADDSAIHFWDVAMRKELARAAMPWAPYSMLSFAPDGKTVASRWRDTSIRLWEVATGKELQRRSAHSSGVWDVAFSADGAHLATHAGEDAVHVWRASTGEQRLTLPVDTANSTTTAVSLCFAPKGKSIVFADNRGAVNVRDSDNGKETRRFSLAPDTRDLHEIRVSGLAVSGDGKTLTALARHEAYEGGLAGPKVSALTAVWDLATGEQIRRRDRATTAAGVWALSPDGRLWAAFSQGARVDVYAAADGERLLTIDGKCDGVWPAVISPDGRLLAGVCHHGKGPEGMDDFLSSIAVWELATGAEVRRFKLKPGSPIVVLAFSADGRILASGGDESVGLQLWDLTTGDPLHRYGTIGATIRSLSLDAAGRRLASGLADGSTLLWDAAPFTRRAGPRPGQRTPSELDRWWRDLAARDAGKAHSAMWALAGAGEQAVGLIRDRMPPAKVDAERIRRLIADLDSDQLDVRQAATRALEQLGQEAEPQLRKALTDGTSTEERKRIDALLAGSHIVRSPEVARQIRAVQVLERVGSPAARRHLEALAGGPPEARQTQEAKVSLERLLQRSGHSGPR